MKTHRFVMSLVVVFLAFGFARAEEEDKPDPTKAALTHIDQGKEALLAGDSEAALEHLQKAIGLIQQTVEKKLETFLPKALEGWTRGDVNTSSGSWGSGEGTFQMTTATCEYTHKETERQISVQVSNSPQLLMGLKQMIEMFGNEQYRAMMAANANMKLEEVSAGGFKAWLMVDKEGSAQVMAAAEKIMVQVEGDAEDAAAVKAYWSAIDHEGLAGSGKR